MAVEYTGSRPPTPEEQYPILRYFRYEHLPLPLATVSKRFYDLAYDLVEGLPPGEELREGLRKLLEAKDCFVRACLK